jgi:ribosomal 50S subunit-associated protein YjgA (DUF615 family)
VDLVPFLVPVVLAVVLGLVQWGLVRAVAVNDRRMDATEKAIDNLREALQQQRLDAADMLRRSDFDAVRLELRDIRTMQAEQAGSLHVLERLFERLLSTERDPHAHA